MGTVPLQAASHCAKVGYSQRGSPIGRGRQPVIVSTHSKHWVGGTVGDPGGTGEGVIQFDMLAPLVVHRAKLRPAQKLAFGRYPACSQLL